MILKVRLEAMKKHKKTKYPNAKYVNERFNIANNTSFFKGKHENLSQKYNDITSNCNWYDSGYVIYDMSEFIDFNQLKS